MPVIFRDDADARIRLLAAKMGWDERTAAGCMKFLWQDSQAVGLWKASREEILFWCREHDAAQGTRLIAALLDNAIHFIKPAGHSQYEITGNRVEIKKIDALRKQRIKAAEKRWGIEDDGCEPHSDSQCEGDAGRNAGGSANAMPLPLPAQPSPAQQERDTSGFDHEMAKRWVTFAKEVMPKLRPNLDDYAKAIRLLREKDGLTEQDVEAVFAYVRDDPFWRTNAVSPAALRNKSKNNGLKKIENVMLSMQQRGKAPAKPAKVIPVFTEADLDALD